MQASILDRILTVGLFTLAVVSYVAWHAGYDKLTDPGRAGGPLTLALCWSHFRRRFYEIAKGGNAPIASEALARIGALYEIEAEIRVRSADERRAARLTRTRPLVVTCSPYSLQS